MAHASFSNQSYPIRFLNGCSFRKKIHSLLVVNNFLVKILGGVIE
jgi:hypothetical protein